MKARTKSGGRLVEVVILSGPTATGLFRVATTKPTGDLIEPVTLTRSAAELEPLDDEARALLAPPAQLGLGLGDDRTPKGGAA